MAKRAPEFQTERRGIPRDLFPNGEVRFSYGTTKKAEITKRKAALAQLIAWAAWDVLHAIKHGHLDLASAVATVKDEGEASLLTLRAMFAQQTAEDAAPLPTLHAEAAEYLVHYKRERKDRSFIQVRSRLKRVLEQKRESDGAEIGGLQMDALLSEDIRLALHQISAAAGTQNTVRAALSGLFTWSVGREKERARKDHRSPKWTHNPAAEIEQRLAPARTATASTAQAKSMLASAEIHQMAYLRAFLHLGFREDELIHTRLHLDLDTDTWMWKVQSRAPDPRCKCPQCNGKGWSPKVERSHRALLVPEVRATEDGPELLRSAILNYLAAYPAGPGDFIFRNPRTEAVWSQDCLRADFYALCKRAGVRTGSKVPGGLVVHDLRATCATQLDLAGVSLKVIAYMLGDSADTIMDKYLRIKPAEQADAVRRGPSYSLSEPTR